MNHKIFGVGSIAFWMVFLTACEAPSSDLDNDLKTSDLVQDGWVTTRIWPTGAIRRQVFLRASDSVKVQVFFENGQLDRVGNYQGGKKHGVWQAYYPNGFQWSEHFYETGLQTGAYKTWHPNGQRAIDGAYDENGQPTGIWTFSDETGQIQQTLPADSLPNR